MIVDDEPALVRIAEETLAQLGYDAAGFHSSTAALEGPLRENHDKTQPVLELFKRKEYVVTVDATRAPEEVHAEIRDRLGLPA